MRRSHVNETRERTSLRVDGTANRPLAFIKCRRAVCVFN
jgi:hypothetical protein